MVFREDRQPIHRNAFTIIRVQLLRHSTSRHVTGPDSTNQKSVASTVSSVVLKRNTKHSLQFNATSIFEAFLSPSKNQENYKSSVNDILKINLEKITHLYYFSSIAFVLIKNYLIM